MWADICTVSQKVVVYTMEFPYSGGTLNCTALKKMYTKAELIGNTNIPLATQLKTTRSTIQPPSMPSQANATRPSTAHKCNTQRPSVHYTALEEDLEEINADDIHDTVDGMITSTTAPDNNSHNDAVIPYLVETYSCSNSIISTTNTDSKQHIKRILVYSGAIQNMINNAKLFHKIHPSTQQIKNITLADGITTTLIVGCRDIHGTTSDGTPITISNRLFVQN